MQWFELVFWLLYFLDYVVISVNHYDNLHIGQGLKKNAIKMITNKIGQRFPSVTEHYI